MRRNTTISCLQWGSKAGRTSLIRRKRTCAVGLSLLGALCSTALLMPKPDTSLPASVFVNLSPSMPLGVYRVVGGEPTTGDEVLMPASEVPHFGLKLPYRYFLKRVIARGGERVRIDRAGLWIDGKLVASRVKPFGVSFNGTLASGQVLVLGENPRSFDSRYFGPVSRATLWRVEPILTW